MEEKFAFNVSANICILSKEDNRSVQNVMLSLIYFVMEELVMKVIYFHKMHHSSIIPH